MKKASKILLGFVIAAMAPALALAEFSAMASLAWIFAIVIGQAFGQFLAPYYAKGQVPKIGEPEA